MLFHEVYFVALAVIIGMMIILWITSIFLKNVSIVDMFWGIGFVLAAVLYFLYGNGLNERKFFLLILVVIWGLRLSGYLAWRNMGKGEDFRYKEFRDKYGKERYWWISFFQTFLLQGILMWLISAPLLGAMYNENDVMINIFDFFGFIFWLIGIIFEIGGDIQLSRFKAESKNIGKVLDKGFWKYTRHPNYFGDAMVWLGFGTIAVAAGSYISFLGSVLMIFLLLKVSGVALLEKTLKETKPQYQNYIQKTSAFVPWFPKT